eukprot:gene4971-6333_t
MVAVAKYDSDKYNEHTCFGAAALAATRGIKVLDTISLMDSAVVEEIVGNLRDNLKPDAVIWCDWAACALPDSIQQYNPLPYFKKANYLPKALSMLDCVDEPGVVQFYEEGLFQYVSAGQFVNEKLVGPDYTEDNYPYSSVFRPAAAKGQLTVTEQLNVGFTASYPSSTKLFMEWYRSVTNATAGYQTVFTWAALDLMEAALYR